MSNEVTTVNLTPEIFKSKLLVALSKAEISIQALHDAESELVYNEDNLETIAKFLKDAKAAKKLIDDERKRLKEPSLIEGRNIDAGAKLVDSELDVVITKANVPYQKLCAEVEKRRQEAEAEKQRVAGIREQMNNFKNDFAARIANAKTSAEIVSLERLFNLETGNKNRYQEFLNEFSKDCEAIRSHLRVQKEKVRELEELERNAKEAAENGSDEQILEIMEKKEVLEAEIAEKAINIQEIAVNQASQPTESATVILPLIPKGGRRLWKYEVVDEKQAAKAGLMKLVPDEDAIDAVLKEIRDSETETTKDGVRYFIFRKF